MNQYKLLNNNPNKVYNYIDYSDNTIKLYDYSFNIFGLISNKEIYIKNKKPTEIIKNLLNKIKNNNIKIKLIKLHNILDTTHPILDYDYVANIV